MARYRKIDVRMWGDEKFRRLSPLQPSAQGLWLYLLTNPETVSIPGLFRAGEAAMAEALGWPLKGFREAFQELFREGLAKADWKARIVWIPNVIRYNPPENPNVVKGWLNYWDEIPECTLKVEAYQHLHEVLKGFGEGFLKPFEKGCPNPLAKSLANQEQEPEQEVEPEPEEEKHPPLSPKGDVEDIFEFWKRERGHPQAILDKKRRRAISARLKEGYTIGRIKWAIRGIERSPYHMGKNDRQMVYDDIALICRDGKHVDQFADLEGGAVQPHCPHRNWIKSDADKLQCVSCGFLKQALESKPARAADGKAA